MSLDVVVMFLVLVPAAVLQDTVTPLPWVSATCPWLIGLPVYYGLCRTPLLTAVAAVWSGVVLDALSGLPLGVSALLFLGLGFLCWRLRRVVIAESSFTAGAFGGAGAVVMTLLHGAILSVHYDVGGFLGIVAKALICGGLGWAGAAAVFVALRTLDRFAANVKTREDVDEYGWRTKT
jgi:hypothetical protein